jgi:hypothetical protein
LCFAHRDGFAPLSTNKDVREESIGVKANILLSHEAVVKISSCIRTAWVHIMEDNNNNNNNNNSAENRKDAMDSNKKGESFTFVTALL